MRTITACLVVVLAALSAGEARAQADPYPWCAQYSGGGLGGASNCYFMTIEQCRATVSGVGGYCSPNPFYTGPSVGQQNPAPRRRPQPRYY